MTEFLEDFTDKEDDNVLFIFDLNSITSRQHLKDEPLSLAIFTELVDLFKPIGIDAYMFKYVADENLIISDSKALTISYMNSLKEKVKAEYRPLTIEEVYTFTSPIRHKDIVNTEIEFIDKYNIDEALLCSTIMDYTNKTITIKSKAASVKRTIPYFVANLIESCSYITDYSNKMSINAFRKPVKYPYRELIRDLYSTDFINRIVVVNLPKDDDVKVDYTNMFSTYNPSLDNVSVDDKIVANTIETIVKEEFTKSEDTSYVEAIDTITDEQINEFFEKPELFNEPLVCPDMLPFNSINYNQTEAAHTVAEALIKESNKVSNNYNVSDYSPPFNDTLYSRQDA